MQLYTIVWVFYIYAMLGWCAEVAFAAAKTRAFVNRGFLNGPWCPIYGVGMVIVALCLTPIQDNLLLLFLGSALLTSLLELATGFVLEKCFDDKWWDYTDMPLNIGGYICLTFSLLWGVACVLLMRIVHPLVLRFIHMLDNRFGYVLTVCIGILFLADVIMTVSMLLHLKRQLRLITAVNAHMRAFSDQLGEGISARTIAAIDASEKAKTDLAEVRLREEAELSQKRRRREEEQARRRERWEAEERRIKEELAASRKKTREELERFLARRGFGERRILKAFPSYRNGKMQEALDRLTAMWDGVDRKKK